MMNLLNQLGLEIFRRGECREIPQRSQRELPTDSIRQTDFLRVLCGSFRRTLRFKVSSLLEMQNPKSPRTQRNSAEIAESF